MKINYIISALLFTFSLIPVHAAAEEYQMQKDEVVMLVNEQRTANGKKALYESALLNQAAQIRAQEIINDFSHTRPNGKSGLTAFEDVGGSYQAVGENIAYGYPTEADVMAGWMQSQGHRANILSDSYQAIGVGVASDGYALYWVQMFTDGKGLTPIYSVGNINRDSLIDAADASVILTDAAEQGAGKQGILSRMQRNFADVNHSQTTDSEDASIILRYAAYAGTGGTESIESFCGLS